MLQFKRITFLIVLTFAYQTTVALAPKNQLYWYKAIAAVENEHLSEAIVWLDSAIYQNPKNLNYLLKKGEVLFLNEKFKDALSVFQLVEKKKNGSASLWMAKTFAQLGKNDLAIIELKKYLDSNDKETEANILLDPAFDPIKSSSDWVEIWKADWYSVNERFYAEIEYLFSQKEWNEAIDAITKRLEKGSGNHLMYSLRGEAFFNIGSYKSAEADFSEAIKRAKRYSTYYEWRAKCRVKLKQFNGSLKDINKAIEISEGDPKCLLTRAEALSGLDKNAEAAIDIKQYQNFYPNDIVAQYQLARFSYENTNYLDALFALGKIIRAGKANAECFELRGIIYTKSENWELAIADFTKAIEMQPSKASSLGFRGESLIKQGKIKLGCADLKKAKEMGNFAAQELLYKHCRN